MVRAMVMRLMMFWVLGLFCLPAAVSAEEISVVERGKGTLATLQGSVAFEGEKPQARTFQATKDHAACGTGDHVVEDVRLGQNGALLDVVVEIKDAEGDRPWPQDANMSTIVQKGCRFSPAVCVVPNGQALTVVNSDPVLHNVNSGFFNIAQAIQGQSNDVAVKVDKRRQGRFIRLNCNVHDWMEAWLYVPKSPYVARVDEEGKFSIDQIRPGDYEVVVQHPFLGKETFDVSLGAGEVVELRAALSGG